MKRFLMGITLLLFSACHQHYHNINEYDVHRYCVHEADNSLLYYYILFGNHGGYYYYSSPTQITNFNTVHFTETATMPIDPSTSSVTTMPDEQIEPGGLPNDVESNVATEEVQVNDAGEAVDNANGTSINDAGESESQQAEPASEPSSEPESSGNDGGSSGDSGGGGGGDGD